MVKTDALPVVVFAHKNCCGLKLNCVVFVCWPVAGFINIFVGTREILFPAIVVILLTLPFDAAADDAIADDVANDTLVTTVDAGLLLDCDGDLGSGSGSGSDIGDDGGDDFISSKGGDLLDALLFGAPFNAELLANCK